MTKEKRVYEKVYTQEDLLDVEIFNIDMNILDKEWINQPKIFFRYASQLADARRRMEEVKAEADVVKAEIDLDIRSNPSNYNLEKTTEALISNLILQQEKYQKALAKIRIKKHKVDILQAAVTALEHRKSALERLVSLHGQNYFSTPKAPDNAGREIAEDIEKETARNLVGRKRRRRS